MIRALTLVVALVSAVASANADAPYTLRFATVAPDGSAWARELRLFAREVEAVTDGHVHIKLYFNAVAGDELEQKQRIERGQLDGGAFGLLCEHWIPALRVTRLPGTFRDFDEVTAVMNALQPLIAEEAHQAGFVILASGGLGPDVVLIRHAVHNMAELRRLKVWRWNLDDVGISTFREMGFQIVPAPIYQAAHDYDEKRIDGFVAIPSAALAFQWSAQAHYLLDLRSNYLWGCLAATERSFAPISPAYQAAIRNAGSRLQHRIGDVINQMDNALLGGAFQKQGVIPITMSPGFRAEYVDAARLAREHLANQLVPKEVLDRVMRMLADYRAEHGR